MDLQIIMLIISIITFSTANHKQTKTKSFLTEYTELNFFDLKLSCLCSLLGVTELFQKYWCYSVAKIYNFDTNNYPNIFASFAKTDWVLLFSKGSGICYFLSKLIKSYLNTIMKYEHLWKTQSIQPNVNFMPKHTGKSYQSLWLPGSLKKEDADVARNQRKADRWQERHSIQHQDRKEQIYGNFGLSSSTSSSFHSCIKVQIHAVKLPENCPMKVLPGTELGFNLNGTKTVALCISFTRILQLF